MTTTDITAQLAVEAEPAAKTTVTRKHQKKSGTVVVDGPIFDDGKDPQAMRTIGEVAKALNIRPHVLRYWEEQFPALKPVKRSGSRRYYRPEDVAIIVEIDRLVHREGYTLRGAAMVIGGKGKGVKASGAQMVVSTVQDAPVEASTEVTKTNTSVFVPQDQHEFFVKLADIRATLAQALAAA